MAEHETFDPGITPEDLQKAKDRDCDLGKREHKWQWIWIDGRMTDHVRCTTCGQERHNDRNYYVVE